MTNNFIDKIEFKEDFPPFRKGDKVYFGGENQVQDLIKFYLKSKGVKNAEENAKRFKINCVLGNNGGGKTTLFRGFYDSRVYLYNRCKKSDGTSFIYGEKEKRLELKGEQIIYSGFSCFDNMYSFISNKVYNRNPKTGYFDIKLDTLHNIQWLKLNELGNTSKVSMNIYLNMYLNKNRKEIFDIILKIYTGFDNGTKDIFLSFSLNNDILLNSILYRIEDILVGYKHNTSFIEERRLYKDINNFTGKLIMFAFPETLDENYKKEKISDLEIFSDKIKREILPLFADYIVTLYFTEYFTHGGNNDFEKGYNYLLTLLDEDSGKYTINDIINDIKQGFKNNIDEYELAVKINNFYIEYLKKIGFIDNDLNQIKFINWGYENKNNPQIYGKWKEQVLLNDLFHERINTDLVFSSEKIEKKYSFFSSGEKVIFYSFLNILSSIFYNSQYRINDVYNYVYSNLEKNFVILIDEPDLHLHLDWQKKYIQKLIDVFSNLDTEIKLHFIIATHSPFIISDLPNEAIVILDGSKTNKYNGKYTEIKSYEKKTFGANFIDLIRDGFFFEDKVFMGSFAENIISELAENERKKFKLNDDKNEELQDNKKIKEQIGDSFLRDNLLYFKVKNND